MLCCNEVATRGGRGEVTDWVVTGGGHPPLSAASKPPTYILELETFLKLRYLISDAKSFLESFQSVLKSEIVEVHRRADFGPAAAVRIVSKVRRKVLKSFWF